MDGWPTDPRHHCRFHASLVALPPERDLLIRAKHLFVATKLSGYGPALRAQLGPVRQCPEKPLCARSAVSAGETIQAVVITQNGAIVLNRGVGFGGRGSKKRALFYSRGTVKVLENQRTP